MEEYNYIRKSNVKKRKVSSNRKHKNNKSSRANNGYIKSDNYRNSEYYTAEMEYGSNRQYRYNQNSNYNDRYNRTKTTRNKKNTRHRAKHSNNRYKYQTRKINKKKVFFVIAIPLIIIISIIIKNNKNEGQKVEEVSSNNLGQKLEITENTTSSTNQTQGSSIEGNYGTENTIDQNTESTSGKDTENTSDTNSGQNTGNTASTSDWRIRLANYNHQLPEDFEVELADIDSTRQFDARAIKYLKDMLNDMREDGNTNIWVQSSYRSVKRQKELYDNSIQKYLKQGKSEEEAIKLTDEYINRPGCSDHNLGLAVDFNYVDNSFEDTKEFKWLQENAENYGFILRYPKDKEDITTIAYESWHWRYVGEEHAKKMNELNMCLEEYVEYLENG